MYTDPQIHCTRGEYPSYPGCLHTAAPQIFPLAPSAVLVAELLSSLPPSTGRASRRGMQGSVGHTGCDMCPSGDRWTPACGASPAARASGTHGWGSGPGLGLGRNTVSSSHKETTDIRGVGVQRARGSPKSRTPTAPLSNPCCLCVSTTKKRHFSGGHQQSGGLGGPGQQRAWLCLHGTARTPAKASELQHMVGSRASRLTELQSPRSRSPAGRVPTAGLQSVPKKK